MSDNGYAIRTAGLGKDFVSGRYRPTVFGLFRSILRGRVAGADSLRSLDCIDFDVRRDEMVGLVGENGAGKTTLLKTLAGIFAPSRGEVHNGGVVTLLAGLGVGMVEDLSVRENVFLYGAICGVPRGKLLQNFEAIVRWAELEGFERAALRTLSTGMRTRLAFAIAMHIDSDLLLLDEAFSSGDQRFQDRCEQFFASGEGPRSVLVATHNLDFVRRFCARTLWLHRGQQMSFGPTVAVLHRYLAYVPR
jgi:lipopolysaccharide transport system ATP-binding protein